LDPQLEQASDMKGSIFEKTGHRTSVSSSDFAFFSMDFLHAPPKFRPLSSFSITSVYSPPNGDDTMIGASYCTHLQSL